MWALAVMDLEDDNHGALIRVIHRNVVPRSVPAGGRPETLRIPRDSVSWRSEIASYRKALEDPGREGNQLKIGNVELQLTPAQARLDLLSKRFNLGSPVILDLLSRTIDSNDLKMLALEQLAAMEMNLNLGLHPDDRVGSPTGSRLESIVRSMAFYINSNPRYSYTVLKNINSRVTPVYSAY
jgi:hypothetical protein